MKRIILLTFLVIFVNQLAKSQCTPFDCSASLPAYGGICDTLLLVGMINTPYADQESFIVTDNCFDAGLIDSTQAGLGIKITNADMFTISGTPVGISVATDANSYSPPAGGYLAGCVGIQGTPTEAGRFNVILDFLADVDAYILGGGGCTGFAFPNNDNAVNYVLELIIKPDATFTGLNSSYCITDQSTFLMPATTGGSFSGPGMFGSSFNPSNAGVGTHTISYVVSAQQGAAIGPATDTFSQTVVVYDLSAFYRDVDGDGYGDASDAMTGCSAAVGYVADSTDCDDMNVLVNPGATEICNFADDNCNNIVDEGKANLTPVLFVLPSNVQGVSSVGIAVKVSETDNFNSDGSSIKVNIPSDPRLTFKWDPLLTFVALQPVDNSEWNYLGDNGFIHQFEFIGTLGALSLAPFGINAVYDPQGTDGQTTISATVVPFSGGECYATNNTDAELLEYFD